MGADESCANVVHLPSSARIGLASGWLRLCRIASPNDIPGKRSSFIILCLAPIDSNLSPTIAAPHRRQQMACPPLYPPPYSFNLPYERSMGDPLGRASASQRHGPTSTSESQVSSCILMPTASHRFVPSLSLNYLLRLSTGSPTSFCSVPGFPTVQPSLRAHGFATILFAEPPPLALDNNQIFVDYGLNSL